MKLSLPLLVASLILAAFASTPVIAQEPMSELLLPMGGGYADLYRGMLQTIVQNAHAAQVNILILPTAYSTDPISITDGERQTNLKDAETRRFEVQEACKRLAPSDVTCSVVTVPVFTRDDANDPATLRLFAEPLSAIFILGGDQTVAMQVIMDTPLETRLEELYHNGVIVAGTSAGCGVQAYHMLGGYQTNFAEGNSLYFGAPDMWNKPDRHGLTFGMQNAIIDQHFFQRGRFGRLLNAINLPEGPHVGIGVDAFTGLHVRDGHLLGGVFGLYAVAVLDAETYHAADNARYLPLANDANKHILSVRNVLVHLLAQGEHTYDVNTRRHSLGTPLPKIEREFDALTLPESAGSLILSGSLGKDPSRSEILTRFVDAANGNGQKRILILAAGFPSKRSAQTNAETVAEVLPIPTEILAVDESSKPITIPDEITGIIFIARDPSLINLKTIAPIKDAWLSGMPLLADNAAASVLGVFYSNHGPIPDESEQAEIATQKSFIAGITDVQPGIGLLNVIIEPRLLDDNRWGRWFSVAHAHPEVIALGLNDNTALIISTSGTKVIGEDGIFILDLRTAKLGLGTNDGYVIANGLLDVFAPGEIVGPLAADVNAIYERQPTPILPTITPTSKPIVRTTPVIMPTSLPRQTQPLPISSVPLGKRLLCFALEGALLGALIFLLFRKKR
jgi:cyanophycinase